MPHLTPLPPRHFATARGLGALLLLAASGCESSTTAKAPATQATSTSSGTGPGSAGAPASRAPAGVRLRVAHSVEHGAYLTDLSGRALYLLESHEASQAGCHDRCVGVWPPLFAGAAAPTAADSALDPRLAGTTRRRDGMLQVSYNGHPLYYYIGDGGPGQTLGHQVEDAWGEWYLVSPGGREVDHARRHQRHE